MMNLSFSIPSLCSLDQRSCHETVPPLPGREDGPGKEVHPQGPRRHTCVHPGRSCSNPAGESWRVNGPEFIPHHAEITHTTLFLDFRLFQRLLPFK